MRAEKLDSMVRGWFVGNFEPSLWKTENCEVGVKCYKAGDREDWHYHTKSTEFTVVLNGQVKMDGTVYNHGDIIIMEPYDVTDFTALTDVITVVVRNKSVKGDKFIGAHTEERI